MITEGICSAIFTFVSVVLGILPIPVLDLANGASGLTTILAYGLYFFPADIWLLAISNGAIMIGVSFLWAIIEWVYKKIPGVD